MSLQKSILQGALRFAVVSLIGYSLWAWSNMGTALLYSSIAVVFVALSGAALRPLGGSARTLAHFYGVFAAAFISYAALWCVGWFVIKGHTGEIIGSACGLAVCGWILLRLVGAESQTRHFLSAWAVLFLFHTLGYTVGGWGYYHGSSSGAIPHEMARLIWGLGHGLGFGAGLGYVLFHCRSAGQGEA
ncbi:MAG: hypothetical protein KDN22_15445 [Verrucomicrobiae bacterium]|nr:hypothetical protein [Verrucomicrobiae bacterium]